MARNHLSSREGAKVRVIERSIFSARSGHTSPGNYSIRACFVEVLRQRGSLTSVECEVLEQWFHLVTSALEVRVDLVIYLRTSPERAMERMRIR